MVAAGPSALAWPPSLDADRPWLVVVASFPLGEPASAGKAEALVSKLRAEGWGDAEVLDSRSARALDCCYLVVTLGRWTSREAAGQAQRSVKPGRSANLRRAF